MPRSQIPKRTEPKDEISHPIQKHNRPYTGPRSEPRQPLPVPVALNRQWQQFVDTMKNMPPTHKAQFIREQPFGIQEMCYLIVEATGTPVEKELVLAYLPKPGQRARERFAPFIEAVAGSDTAPQVKEREVPAAVVAEALAGGDDNDRNED